MNRRELLACLAAGGVVVAGELWMPGRKLISIPSGRIYTGWHYESGVAVLKDGVGIVSLSHMMCNGWGNICMTSDSASSNAHVSMKDGGFFIINGEAEERIHWLVAYQA